MSFSSIHFQGDFDLQDVNDEGLEYDGCEEEEETDGNVEEEGEVLPPHLLSVLKPIATSSVSFAGGPARRTVKKLEVPADFLQSASVASCSPQMLNEGHTWSC